MKDIVKEINKITNQPYILELPQAKIISASVLKDKLKKLKANF